VRSRPVGHRWPGGFASHVRAASLARRAVGGCQAGLMCIRQFIRAISLHALAYGLGASVSQLTPISNNY